MIDGIILSFQLFSRIPIKKSVDYNSDNIKIALIFFPILGFIIGALTGLVVNLVFPYSKMISGAIGILVYIFLSGGIHLDGLADVCDGFFSNRDPERILEIMKDSMIGTFGVLALVCYGILKASIYGEMGSINLSQVFYFGIVSYLARFSTLILILRSKIVRPGGFGSAMETALKGSYAVAIHLFIIILLSFYDFRVLILAIFSILNAEMLRIISKKKIGGVTGDVYGTNTELNEIFLLLLIWGLLWI